MNTCRKIAGWTGAAILVFCIAISASGCAMFKPVARTINSAAEFACAEFFSEKQGISLEDAARSFCKTRDQLDPWIDSVLAAKAAAGKVAVERQAK
jgi:hypothetical protein